jgi:hypothetical protein
MSASGGRALAVFHGWAGDHNDRGISGAAAIGPHGPQAYHRAEPLRRRLGAATADGAISPDAPVVWFDAHADLNTPESTSSRYLGVALSGPLDV